MKRLTAISFLLMVFFAVQAQMQDPVKFKSELKTGSGPEAEMIFSATIDPGWHVYSTNLGQDGPIEASLHVNKKDGVELVGKLTPKGKEISQYDEMFGMKLRYFENAVQFVQKVKFTKPQYDIDAYLEWGACNDEMCMPPGEVVLKKSGKSPAVETSPSPSEGGENVPAEASAEEKEKADATEDAAAVQADSAAVDTTLNASTSQLRGPLATGHSGTACDGQRRQHCQPFAVVHPADGLRRWFARRGDALHLADHPDDGELLPEACEDG